MLSVRTLAFNIFYPYVRFGSWFHLSGREQVRAHNASATAKHRHRVAIECGHRTEHDLEHGFCSCLPCHRERKNHVELRLPELDDRPPPRSSDCKHEYTNRSWSSPMGWCAECKMPVSES